MRKRGQSSSRAGQVGLGAYIFDDRSGLVGRTGLQLTYAYHIPMDDGQLSFGLSGTVWQFRIRKEDARLLDPTDDFFNNMVLKVRTRCFVTNIFDCIRQI